MFLFLFIFISFVAKIIIYDKILIFQYLEYRITHYFSDYDEIFYS